MSEIDSASINCIITSPPYWQLRDYGWSGQWGLEQTYQEYLDHLIQFMSECKRVLKDDGTIWINLGDTYNGNKNGNTTEKNRAVNNKSIAKKKCKGLPNKCLMLIPHRFAIRCIDELNLILRNDIIWAKRNGMVESVTDRFSKKHEFFFFFVKQEKYYFDLDSIKDFTKTKDSSNRNRDITKLNNTPGRTKMNGLKTNNYDFKNPGDVSDFWNIPTKGSNEKHYAMFNNKLIEKPIIVGCPKGGVILDPFAGTGTTLVRARELGRNVLGFDGKQEYVNIVNNKLDSILITI
ncbi:MAG: site-specific DNA-methyltransferase [Actinomycetota bacterium]